MAKPDEEKDLNIPPWSWRPPIPDLKNLTTGTNLPDAHPTKKSSPANGIEVEVLPGGLVKFSYTSKDAPEKLQEFQAQGGTLTLNPNGTTTFSFTGTRAQVANIGSRVLPSNLIVPDVNLSFIEPKDGPQKAIATILSQHRCERFLEELKDPQVRAQVHACARMETSDLVALLEAMMNYADRYGKTLVQTIHSGFYGPVNRGGLADAMNSLTPAKWEEFNRALPIVLAGSNTTSLATDQGLPNEHIGPRWVVNGGDTYSHHGGNPVWANMIKAEAAALEARGPNIAANTTDPKKTPTLSLSS